MNKLSSWFFREKKLLVLITITGIFYNVGMAVGPWFEGQLVQTLLNILEGTSTFLVMLKLAMCYVLAIVFVQGMRYFKRLYVRKFANELLLSMKDRLYEGVLHRCVADNAKEKAGGLLTKAVRDVEACVEGMRKFTTEVFDTGVVMVTYFIMLMSYDVRLTLICLIFPTCAYWIAAKLKKVVTNAGAQAKLSSEALNEATLMRVNGALTWRCYGEEERQNELYESVLSEYEQKSVRSLIYANSMQPLYQMISLISTGFIFYFGAKNVMHIGWSTWDIASFTTYLACYLKLAKKAASSAKLFNAVQKARVSWKRIQPFLADVPERNKETKLEDCPITFEHVDIYRPDGTLLLEHVDFTARAGTITAITGEVASGKSLLGRTLVQETKYRGKVMIKGHDLEKEPELCLDAVGYLGHDPELFSASIEENIRLGKEGDLSEVLQDCCLLKDLESMEDGMSTWTGEGGVELSGGQRARIALARVLFHKRPVLVLDDPFSAVDKATEQAIFDRLKERYSDCTILLISHRLALFAQCDQVLYLRDRQCVAGDHATLMEREEGYRKLVELQREGRDLDEE